MPSFLATARSNKLPSTGTGNITSETQINGSDGNLLVCPFEGSLVMQTPGNARRFKLSIAGYGVSGTTSTFTLKLYFGTSTTIASNGTAMISATTASFASTNQNFFLNVELIYDSVSKSFAGVYYGQAANTLIDLTAITQTSVTTVSDVAEGQGFSLTGIFNSTNASNNLVVTTFEIIPD